MEIKIRKCVTADLNDLREIAHQTFDDTFRHLNTPENMQTYLDRAFSLEKLKEELSNPFSTFYFLLVEDKLAGYMKLNEYAAQTDLKDPKSLEIERIYVKKEFQSIGIGRRLISKAIEIARERNKEYVWLGVWEKNQNAIAFYRKMGFQAVSNHAFYVGDERQIDLIMSRNLLV